MPKVDRVTRKRAAGLVVLKVTGAPLANFIIADSRPVRREQ